MPIFITKVQSRADGGHLFCLTLKYIVPQES